jgi:hypothetical protein
MDSLIVRGEIKMTSKLPDCPHLVVFRNETFYIDRSEEQLLTVDRFQPWRRLAPSRGLFPCTVSKPGRSSTGHLLCVALNDQRLFVLNDPFDRLPLFHLERLSQGSGTDQVVLLLVIRTSPDYLYL